MSPKVSHDLRLSHAFIAVAAFRKSRTGTNIRGYKNDSALSGSYGKDDVTGM